MTPSYYAGSPRMARTPRSSGVRLAAFASDLGWMAAVWQNELLARLTFGYSSPQAAILSLQLAVEPVDADRSMNNLIKRLQAFAAGTRKDDFLDVALFEEDKTPFQRAVIERCRRIPLGESLSYGELAKAVGHPGAARAVGTVMSTNRHALIVPCHRVVGARGALGGYSAPAGIQMKRRLLQLESGLT